MPTRSAARGNLARPALAPFEGFVTDHPELWQAHFLPLLTRTDLKVLQFVSRAAIAAITHETSLSTADQPEAVDLESDSGAIQNCECCTAGCATRTPCLFFSTSVFVALFWAAVVRYHPLLRCHGAAFAVSDHGPLPFPCLMPHRIRSWVGRSRMPIWFPY